MAKLQKYSAAVVNEDEFPTMEEDEMGHYVKLSDIQMEVENITQDPKYDYDYAQQLKDVLDVLGVPFDA